MLGGVGLAAKRCLCIAQTQNQAAAVLGLLRQNQINGSMVPTPRRFIDASRGKTCSYSVEIPPRYVSEVRSILREAGMENEIICF